jgi:hypothetical protein
MSYYDTMEAFHRRVAGIYKAAAESGMEKTNVDRAIDRVIADVTAELAKRRSQDGKPRVVKAIIF